MAGTTATSGLGEFIERHRRWVVVAVCAIVTLVALAVYRTSRGSVASVPAARVLPLAPGMRVIATGRGPAVIDATIPKRYRYLAVAGAPGMSSTALIEAEIELLRDRGWSHASSSEFFGNAPTATPVPVSASGAQVLIHAPSGTVYAAVSRATGMSDADRQEDGTPLYASRAIATALRQDRPVLLVVLGHLDHD